MPCPVAKEAAFNVKDPVCKQSWLFIYLDVLFMTLRFRGELQAGNRSISCAFPKMLMQIMMMTSFHIVLKRN